MSSFKSVNTPIAHTFLRKDLYEEKQNVVPSENSGREFMIRSIISRVYKDYSDKRSGSNKYVF